MGLTSYFGDIAWGLSAMETKLDVKMVDVCLDFGHIQTLPRAAGRCNDGNFDVMINRDDWPLTGHERCNLEC